MKNVKLSAVQLQILTLTVNDDTSALDMPVKRVDNSKLCPFRLLPPTIYLADSELVLMLGAGQSEIQRLLYFLGSEGLEPRLKFDRMYLFSDYDLHRLLKKYLEEPDEEYNFTDAAQED